MSDLKRYDKFFDFEKVDEGEGIVYGWAIVCTIDGDPYVDLQGDHIPVDAMLDAAAEFMGKSIRPGLDMHAGDARGDIVFALPITKRTHKQLGMTSDREGLYIGWKPRDAEAMALVKSGDRLGFSIGGWIEETEDVEVTKSKNDGADVATVNGRRYAQAMDDAEQDLIATLSPEEQAEARKYSAMALAKAKTKDKKPKGKYRMFRCFHLDEISIVDRPAQEGALIGFVKRAVIAQRVSKTAVATSSDKGHQHLLDTVNFSNGVGCTYSARIGSGSEYSYHSHDLIADPVTGKITILDNAGHGHTVPDDAVYVAPVTATQGVPDGGSNAVAYVTANAKPDAVKNVTSGSLPSSVAKSQPDTPEKKTMTPEQIELLNKRLAKAETLAVMSDAEKAYLAKLGPTQGEDFLAKSALDRASMLKADDVVYTATDGTVFRKSDDERYWKSAKRADDLEKTVAEERLARKRAEFSKQATEDMGNLPGDSKCHAAVIEAISNIADADLQKAAYEAIRAGNTAMAKNTTTGGSRGSVEKKVGSDVAKGGQDNNVQVIEKKFRDAVVEYQKANGCVSYENALAKATQADTTVRALYDELEEARAVERN